VLTQLANEREHVEAEIGEAAEGLAESARIMTSLKKSEAEMQSLAFVASQEDDSVEPSMIPPPPQFGDEDK
jgi:hypothetical protein